jgi:cobalamin biosynthesis protein CobT
MRRFLLIAALSVGAAGCDSSSDEEANKANDDEANDDKSDDDNDNDDDDGDNDDDDDSKPDDTNADDDTSAETDAGSNPGKPSCFENPKTHLEIINACTDSVKIEKHSKLNLLNEDGSLPEP